MKPRIYQYSTIRGYSFYKFSVEIEVDIIRTLYIGKTTREDIDIRASEHKYEGKSNKAKNIKDYTWWKFEINPSIYNINNRIPEKRYVYMIEFESAIWERYFMEVEKAKGIELKNRQNPLGKNHDYNTQKTTMETSSKETMMETPKELLKDLYWSFIERYPDQESFEKALTEYNTRLVKPAPKLDKIVLAEQKIVIQHLWIPFIDEDFEEDEEDKQFVIETDNPKGFTLGELMYKINNTGITETDEYDLSDQDMHFFEGLEYLTDDDPDYPQTKVFYLILGS